MRCSFSQHGRVGGMAFESSSVNEEASQTYRMTSACCQSSPLHVSLV